MMIYFFSFKDWCKINKRDIKTHAIKAVRGTIYDRNDVILAESILVDTLGVTNTKEFFSNEDELRAIWSKPDTRKKLLLELNDKGVTSSQLEDLRGLINAEESDLYDVLAYVAFATNPVKRSERADMAKSQFGVYESKQKVFLDFVLDQYVQSGVSELDDAKLPELLTLKYRAIADAKQELGDIGTIRDTFIGFQEYLYQ